MKPPERFETARLVLRPPTRADAISIYQNYASDAQVTRYLPWSPHTSLVQTEAFLRGCEDAWLGNRRFPYAITLPGASGVIGMIELRLEEFKADIGYVLGAAYWGRGYMTEAMRALVDWSLAQPAIYRVWAICDVENTGSWRVMEKAGMQREGLLRREILHPNSGPQPRDCYIYAVVK